MSDSESLMFHEQTEVESMASVSRPFHLMKPREGHVTPVMLDKPPLPIGKKHGFLKDSPSPPKKSTTLESTTSANRCSDDLASEYSQNIKFHHNRTQGSPSSASEAAAPGTNVSRPAPNAGRNKPEQPQASQRAFSEEHRTDNEEESIQFMVENSSISTRPRVAATPTNTAQHDALQNESIIFHVMDGSQIDAAVATAGSILQLERASESNASTVLFDVVEGKEDVLARPTVQPAKIKDKLPQEERDASMREHPSPQKTAVTNRLQRKQFLVPAAQQLKPPLSAPPQKPKKEKEKEKKTVDASLSAIMVSEESDPVNVPVAPPVRRKSSPKKTPPETTNHRSPSTTQAHLKSEHTTPKAKLVGSAKFPIPAERSQSSDPVDQEAAKHTAIFAGLDDTPLGGLSPRIATDVPIPHPKSPIDPTDPSTLLGMDEWILQAKLYTEHWRLFNDLQREEIARLIQRISDARQPEFFSQTLDTVPKERKPLHAPVGGFAELFTNRQTTVHDAAATHPTTSRTLPRKKTPTRGSSQRHQQYDRRASAAGPPTMGNQSGGGKPSSSPIAQKTQQTSPQVASGGGVFSRLHDTSSLSGAAKLADSLGVVWPPRSPGSLFFLTGTRLTPHQMEEFYKAIDLQNEASAKLHAEFVNSTLADEENKKRGKAPRKGKVMVTRTSILRKAFTLMDIDKKGIIHAVDLPALRHLLEAERQQLEEKTTNEHTLETSVLIRARSEQRKLKGNIDPKRPAVSMKNDGSFTTTTNTGSGAEVMLHDLLIDVIIPLLQASHLLVIDFASLGLLVFGSLGLSEKGANASFIQWRRAALRYFKALA